MTERLKSDKELEDMLNRSIAIGKYVEELEGYEDFVLEDLCEHYGLKASSRKERIRALVEHYSQELKGK